MLEDLQIPRNAANQYSKPAGTTAAPNTTITSSQFNTTVDDLVTDANTPRAIAVGGTGGTTRATAQNNLELGTGNSPTFAGLTVGPVVSTTVDSLKSSANNSSVRISGGNASGAGAFITLSGGTHATVPNEAYHDAAQHVFRTQGSTEVARVRATGGTDGFFVGSVTHIDPAVAEYGVTMTPAGALHVSRNAGHPVNIKRSNSGSLVSFYIGTTQQGVISESAGTVTYGTFCGAHWTQFSDMGTPDILPGTIFETIDEMCVWPGETNLTLPKIRLASEGSRRVYGVFSHWDNETDDAGNPINISDLNVAALGAKFVRIAPGETVQGGDLIECDGNGLGRAQSDDLFRASTVAKVTAGIAVETYWDGSYLVPCTLHCG